MRLLWALLLLVEIVTAVYLLWYRPWRRDRKAYQRGLEDARREMQTAERRAALEGMSVEELEDLLARLRAEQRRRQSQ